MSALRISVPLIDDWRFLACARSVKTLLSLELKAMVFYPDPIDTRKEH